MLMAVAECMRNGGMDKQTAWLLALLCTTSGMQSISTDIHARCEAALRSLPG